MVVHQECLNAQVIAYYEENSNRNYIRLIGWLNGLFFMDIKQQHHQQHLATTTSMHYFNTDLVEDNYGDVDGDGGGNVFQSDDLDDGQYFD